MITSAASTALISALPLFKNFYIRLASFFTSDLCVIVHFLTLFMYRLTLVLSCAMNFKNYPHDEQTCNLKIESSKLNIFTLNLYCRISSGARFDTDRALAYPCFLSSAFLSLLSVWYLPVLDACLVLSCPCCLSDSCLSLQHLVLSCPFWLFGTCLPLQPLVLSCPCCLFGTSLSLLPVWCLPVLVDCLVLACPCCITCWYISQKTSYLAG